MNIKSLRGTRDFYPDRMFALTYVFDIWRAVASRYGYCEFDGPLLEPAVLWKMKSGDEIPEQMYVFEDKGGSEIAVRPEITPTLARMVAAKQKELVKPLRWFSIPRCWRYEAPQSGRLREFFQFNADFLGSDSMKADAEIIMTAIDIMLELGCTKDDFYIRLGNRRLIQSLIFAAGIPKEKLQEVGRLIDKREKLKAGDFELSLSEMGISGDAVGKLKTVLEMKGTDGIDEGSLDAAGKQGLKELDDLLDNLGYYGALEFVEIDFSIMRGFDYYTSTVFEVFDRSREMRAIAGGGRYDDLVEDFGGEKCGGVGYGMGDVVLGLFLKKLGKMPDYRKELGFLVVPVTDSVMRQATEVASALRKKHVVELEVCGRSLRKALDYANSIGAAKVVIVGPKDVADGKVTIRDMQSGDEEKREIGKLVD